ncbi:MAG TPA: nitrogenase component 1 [Syntrophomonadaceae bacterium]|nr:nitrogenase component 1 [Syntrophomonadaceae bacterium]
MSIHLTDKEAEIRESRLGSITNFRGGARELCMKSQAGTLVNEERRFTQCTSCSSTTAVCQLSMIQDAAVVNHAPLGCAGDFSSFNFTNRNGQVKRGMKLQNAHLLSSNLRERDMIYGGAERLKTALREARDRFAPRAIFITASCSSGIIGDDLESIASEAEPGLGVPVVPIHCEGFRSGVWATGFDAAYHGILSKIVKPAQNKRQDLVQIVNFWGSDIFTNLLGRIGLKVNYLVPFATIEQLEHLSEAAAIAQICPTLGTYLGVGLEQDFGVPEVKAPPPYGIAGTDAWLRALGRVVKREKQVEALITEEKIRIGPELDKLREQLAGHSGFVGAGAGHGHGILCLLQDLGLKVAGACVWHHDPCLDSGDPEADSLSHLVNNYGDMPFGVCNKQSFEMANMLHHLHPDIFIVRHHGMAVWGAKLGIPTFLMGDEHFAVGYQGLLNYGHKIADTIANPAFINNLASHSRLPYKPWWFDSDLDAFPGGEWF